MCIEEGADDLESGWKNKKITVWRRIEKGRPEGKKAVCPNLLYPLGLREIHIFEAMSFGELFDHQVFDPAIAGKEDAGLIGGNEKGQIENRKESNKVYIPIVVRSALHHETKLNRFAESFAPFTVFFAPFAAFIWTH
jgi:hypothetical protein